MITLIYTLGAALQNKDFLKFESKIWVSCNLFQTIEPGLMVWLGVC